MKRLTEMSALFLIALLGFGCAPKGGIDSELGGNPFLSSSMDSKEDTGYVNIRGVELHVTLEGELVTPGRRIFDGPAELAQFAVTYLKKEHKFYLEILTEDTTAPERVEWLYQGDWISTEEAKRVERDQLRRFRLREVNAVVLDRDVNRIRAGKVYKAPVPLNPFTIMADADDGCADHNSHIELSQSVYWYLWNPDRSSCRAEVRDMKVTVKEVLPSNPESYPEYDQLLSDNRLDVVVLFAKLDDGDVADDYNWGNVKKLSAWLKEAGFIEEPDAPLGRRFVRRKGALTMVVDIYGPDLFYSVADRTRFRNWQKAVSEHEVVMYNGHSVLGTGYAFEQVEYPDFYQIFSVGSCLSYEYYVRPILAGKGGWDKVDVLSNVEPTYYSENLPLTSILLAKLVEGFENEGRNSWQDILGAVSRKLGHSRFGVSGARGNCFSPSGDQCTGTTPDPDPENSLRYENSTAVDIPDNDAEGVTSTLEVSDGERIGSLSLELDVSHTYIKDLEIILTFNGETHTVWDRQGGSRDNIVETFSLDRFEGMNLEGTWTLKVIDHADRDLGTLNSWALVVTPAE